MLDQLISTVVAGSPCILVVLVVIGGLVWWLRRDKKTQAAWTGLAAQLGLTYTTSPHRMTGELGGRAVLVETFLARSHKSATTYTRIRSDLRSPLPFSLKVYSNQVAGFVESLVGEKDIKTGDDEFDSRFKIESDDAEATRRLLAPSVRAALLSYCANHEVSLTERGLEWDTWGHLQDTVKIRSVLSAQALVCAAVDEALTATVR